MRQREKKLTLQHSDSYIATTGLLAVHHHRRARACMCAQPKKHREKERESVNEKERAHEEEIIVFSSVRILARLLEAHCWCSSVWPPNEGGHHHHHHHPLKASATNKAALQRLTWRRQQQRKQSVTALVEVRASSEPSTQPRNNTHTRPATTPY